MELSKVKGIGEKRKEALNAVGVFDTRGLLLRLPRKYLDLTRLSSEEDLVDKANVLIEATAKKPASVTFYGGMRNTRLSLDFCGSSLTAIWFNQTFLKNSFEAGVKYRFYGKISQKDGKTTLCSPMFERADEVKRLQGVLPVYSEIDGISQKQFSTLVNSSLSFGVSSLIPTEVAAANGLSSLSDAFRQLHFPNSLSELLSGYARVEIERAVQNMLSMRIFGNESDRERLKPYAKVNVDKEIITKLPFPLFKAQEKAISEIVSEMNSNRLMNRFLQGDTGSGKTLVAFVAMARAVMGGGQAALLCPTTTLSMQHFLTISAFAKPFGFKVALLNSGSADKSEVLSELRTGEIDIVVGTQSLFSRDVEYSNLRFIAIDEQHKFGVAERGKLLAKSGGADVLSLSATPIPRSLSLIYYGTLAVSNLDRSENPFNIKSYIIGDDKLSGALDFIADKVRAGGAAYIVCQNIDSNGRGAEDVFKRLKTRFKPIPTALIHGRLSEAEKADVIARFSSGEVKILVSTTVIEVGIDNKNADCMLVFDSDCFGISSLHQLRGRLSRCGQESFCFFHTSGANETQMERLSYLKAHADGADIAEFDLKSRGSGDFFGKSQSGEFTLNAFSCGIEGFKTAKKVADEIKITEQLKRELDVLSDREKYENIVLN